MLRLFQPLSKPRGSQNRIVTTRMRSTSVSKLTCKSANPRPGTEGPHNHAASHASSDAVVVRRALK